MLFILGDAKDESSTLSDARIRSKFREKFQERVSRTWIQSIGGSHEMLQVRKKFNSNFTAAHICQNQKNFFRSVFVNTFHFYNILLVLAIQLILHFYFTGKDRK